MYDENMLRQRLERVLAIMNARADQQINVAENSPSQNGTFRDVALGYGLGARFARDVLSQEFQELWPEDGNE